MPFAAAMVYANVRLGIGYPTLPTPHPTHRPNASPTGHIGRTFNEQITHLRLRRYAFIPEQGRNIGRIEGVCQDPAHTRTLHCCNDDITYALACDCI